MERLKNRVKGLRLALAVLVFTGCGVGRVVATAYSTNVNGAVTDFTQIGTGGTPGTVPSWFFEAAQTFNINNDSLHGFVELRGGFTINDSVNIYLGLIPPVGGTITFAGTGSILTLDRDLYLSTGATIAVTGVSASIDGSGASGTSRTIFMGGDLTIPTTKTINTSGGLIIDGQGNKLTLNGTFAVAAADTLTLKNMTLVLPGSLITFGNAASKLILNNVVIELSGNFATSASGLIEIHNCVEIHGKGKTFTLQNDNASALAIQANSVLYVNNGVTFKYDVAATTYITFTDATSWLYFDGATFNFLGRSVTLATGNVAFDNYVQIVGSSETDILTLTNLANVEVLSGARVAVATAKMVF